MRIAKSNPSPRRPVRSSLPEVQPRGSVPRPQAAANARGAGSAAAPLALRDIRREAPEPAPRESERRSYDSETALRLYLREIGEVPLLTPAQEVELAARIHRGDARARDLMIRSNLRLVVKIAREYEGYGLPLLDMINEGNIGLMRAVEKFDPAKGGKLSTYAAWWIKQSIRRGLASQAKVIRLPIHALDQLSRARRAALSLREELGREPSPEELAEAMGMKSRRLDEIRAAAAGPMSLDTPVTEDGGMSLGEMVGDERARTPYEQLEDKTLCNQLDELVEKLPLRERTILRRRFGLDGRKELTLEQIGAQLGVTRERIRQLQNLALAKLRRMLEEPAEAPLAA